MPYKVKEHLRKTKKGLIRVKEGKRKDRTKRALVIGATTLTTLGLGALAYKRLGSKLINKVDDVAENKVTKLLSSTKPKQTLPDPWLDDVVTTVKSSKPLTVPKAEQRLLTPYKYKAPDYVKSTKPSKGFIKEDGSDQNLKQAVSSNRALIKREGADIDSNTNRLKLGEDYIKRIDSPASVRTGNTYIITANKRLATITKRRSKRSKAKLITRVGKTRNSVRQGESSMLILKKKLDDVPRTPPLPSKTKAKKTLADTLGQSVLKDEMNKKINQSLDDVIPGSGLVRAKVKDVKDRVKQADRLLKELEENGEKISSRRGFFTNTAKKVAKEAAKKPKDPTNIARGVANKSKITITRGSAKLNTEPTIAGRITKGLQVDIGNVKKVYRQPRGLLERLSQTSRRFVRYKSGNQQT